MVVFFYRHIINISKEQLFHINVFSSGFIIVIITILLSLLTLSVLNSIAASIITSSSILSGVVLRGIHTSADETYGA